MTANPYHVIVWIDHRIAHLYDVTRNGLNEILTLHAPDQGGGHIHHKAGTPGPGHLGVAPAFLKAVAEALDKAQEILIVGPADAKAALKKHIDVQMPSLAERIQAVEPMDRVSKEHLHAFAVRFFLKHDLFGPV